MAEALARRESVAAAPRGEDTRQRLIEAALKIFGESGFEGASTRMLADAAGANLAAIPYHFGSKEVILFQDLVSLQRFGSSGFPEDAPDVVLIKLVRL